MSPLLKITTIINTNLTKPVAAPAVTNPAFATHQVIGVFDPSYTEPIAEVAFALGVKRAYVVHNEHGLDELAVTGRNRVSTRANGRVTT